MKLSKRQLKRIIREEKRRILREMGPGHHVGMYGNPGDWGDPNQWDAEVEEEDFCPYSYLEKMKELHPGDYAVDAKLPRMGFDPDTGRELTDHEMQMVYDVIDEEEEERAYAEDMRMMESRRLSKRQLMRIIREEKEKIEEELEEEDNDEGNAFTGALAKAKEQGKDTFKVDGKTYDVKESRRFRSKLLRAIRNQKRLALESKKKKL